MGDVGAIGNYLVAGIFFLVGLYLLDIIKFDWNNAGLRQTKAKGLFAALILGLLFGIALGPCTFAYVAPVLGIVFQTAQTSFTSAAILLLAFGIGHCAVIVGAGTLSKKVQQYLNWSEESKVIHINLPPLKKRIDDIPLLSNHFLKKYTIIYDKNIPHIDDECIEHLIQWHWPGNIRELENAIEYAVIRNKPDKNLCICALPAKIRENIFCSHKDNVIPDSQGTI